ncbi:hypothetical protein [Plantactinospora sonchi]|uniref:DUF1707 domain-containing protein n=1 Tax=Plantactinospora sonchi TaxID=1544735 RepID=A0ABU7RM15_9ACTN
MATGGAIRDDWRETFETEARRRGLPGREIGDALVEVRTYCADTGDDPADAFGDPAEYAAEVARGWRPVDDTGPVRRRLRQATLVGTGTLAGVMALLAGVDALTRDTGGVVTLGQLASIVAGAAGIVLVTALLLRTARRVGGGPDWRFGLATAVGIAVTTSPQLFWRQPVLHAPGWLLAGVGLLLLTLAWWPLVSGRLFGPGAESAGGDRLRVLLRWGLPAALLCVVLVAVLVG